MPTIKTILLVEDDWGIASYWQTLLETAGYRVIHEHMVSDAIDVLDSTPVDLVITDILIGNDQGVNADQGGLEIVSYLALNFDPLPRIIVVSGAFGDSAFVDRNFDRFDSMVALRKPVSDAQLMEAVARSFQATSQNPPTKTATANASSQPLAQSPPVSQQEVIELLKATQFRLKQTQFSLDHAPDGVYWIDKNANFIYTNQWNCDLLGYSKEELLSKTVIDINPAIPNVEFFQSKILPGITEAGVTFEGSHLHKDGTTLIVEISARQLNYEGEQVICAYVRDISKRKKNEAELVAAKHAAEEANGMRHAILKLLGTSDGVWHWDVGTQNCEYAPGFRKLLGFEGNDLIGFPNTFAALESRIHPDDLTTFKNRIATSLKERTVFLCEFRLANKDEEYVWVRSRGHASYDDGKAVRLVGSTYDISDAREAMTKLEKERELLARSNADLAQFAYVASHDLQEPLRAVGGFLQLLEQKYKGQLDEQGQGYIQKAVSGATRMSQLINDLLAYSRLMPVGSDFKRVNLNEIVADVSRELEQTMVETNANIHVDGLPFIWGARPLLVQLFRNLIGNSIKYRTDAPPRVNISATKEGNTCTIRVQDNGIGIAPEYHTQIFDLFKRLHHRSEHAGTGIGLAICKRVVEHLGGSISIESNLGAGACFVIRLPDGGD